MNPDTLSRTDPATDHPSPSIPSEQQVTSPPVAGQSSPYQEVKEAAGEQLRQVSAGLKESGGEALRTAKNAGNSFLRDQQEKFATQLDRYTDAIKAACETLNSTEGNPLLTPAQRASRQMERVAEYLRNRDAMDFLDDLGNFARRKPEIMFGGLFVAGLASVRFLKASSRGSRPSSRLEGRSPNNPSSRPPTASQAEPLAANAPPAPQPILQPNLLK